ncbi:MAG TPA: toll/interleukin-1 receptor domain-containing protein [Candidatus Binatia bacterium]|jgi:hypothetical protein
MAGIFISYRRDDTAPYAGRLYDRLNKEFDDDHVFMDIDAIDPGEDFVEVINQKLDACSAVIALIGKAWLSAADETGGRRLDNPDDYVRRELAAALARKVRVIPVLVGGAGMPRSDKLPDELMPLSRRNAIEISDTRFHSDVDRLVQALRKALATSAVEKAAAGTASPKTGSVEVNREQTNQVNLARRSADLWTPQNAGHEGTIAPPSGALCEEDKTAPEPESDHQKDAFPSAATLSSRRVDRRLLSLGIVVVLAVVVVSIAMLAKSPDSKYAAPAPTNNRLETTVATTSIPPKTILLNPQREAAPQPTGLNPKDNSVEQHDLWLKGPLYGSTNSGAALERVTISKSGNAYEVFITNQFAFTCGLSFDQRGNPSRLSNCNGESNWRAEDKEIRLHCGTYGNEQVCDGRYTLLGGSSYRRANNLITIARKIGR